MALQPPLFSILLLAIAVVWVWFSIRRGKTRLTPQKIAARRLFQKTNFTSTNPAFTLFGPTAQVIREDELYADNPGQAYVLTIFARNAQGEYFMFKSGDPTPYIKHVPHAVAKAVLKEKYQLPPASVA